MLLPFLTISILTLSSTALSTSNKPDVGNSEGKSIKIRSGQNSASSAKKHLNERGTAVNWDSITKEAKYIKNRSIVHAARIKKRGINKRKAQITKRSTPDINPLHASTRVAKKVQAAFKKPVQKATTNKNAATNPSSDVAKDSKLKAVVVDKKFVRTIKSTLIPLNTRFGYTKGIKLDLEYYGVVTIGTKGGTGTRPQVLTTDFNTASGDTWYIKSSAGKAGRFYNPSISGSFTVQALGQFSVLYPNGASASGTVGFDTFNVGGLIVPGLEFGLVDTVSGDFSSDSAAGILGLGFAALSQNGQATFIENLVSRSVLKQNLFALYCTRGQSTGSELSIGALDQNFYTGSIAYTNVLRETYWIVTNNDVVVNNIPIGLSTPAAIDSSAAFIYYPRAVAQAIYAGIKNSRRERTDRDGSVYYSFPCADSPKVELIFSGSFNRYAINSADFSIGASTVDSSMCIGSIIGQDNLDENGQVFAILGSSFLKNWYTVFSFGQGPTGTPSVGFATLLK